MMNEQAKFHIDAWRARVSTQTAFSASEVQDRLFDLYGDLEGNSALEQVKDWLLLTRLRELFSADELGELLTEIELTIEMATLEPPALEASTPA
jgi:hypothetical protein